MAAKALPASAARRAHSATATHRNASSEKAPGKSPGARLRHFLSTTKLAKYTTGSGSKSHPRAAGLFGLRVSAFLRLSDFGLRISAVPRAVLRLSQGVLLCTKTNLAAGRANKKAEVRDYAACVAD